MTNVTVRVEPRRKLSVFTVKGEIDSSEMIRVFSDHYEKHPTPGAIWDLRQADLWMLDIDGLREMVEASKKFVPLRGGKPRTVILTTKSMESLIARLYTDLSDTRAIPTKYNIVVSEEEALDAFPESD